MILPYKNTMKCRMRDGEEESSGVKGSLCEGSGASCTETTEYKSISSRDRERERDKE